MRRPARKLACVVAFAAALAARDASGDTYHIKSPSQIETEKGSKLSLPPGYFLDEKTWQERDLEMKRLQEQETRLKAENASLKKSAAEDYPWLATGFVGVFGIAIGIFTMAVK